jgi:hypothetical protein
MRRPPSPIHPSPGRRQRSHRLCISPEPSSQTLPRRGIECREPRSANRRRDVKQSLGTWLPRPGQQVPTVRVAHHAATYIYQQTLASRPSQAAIQLRQRQHFHPDVYARQPNGKPQTTRNVRAARTWPGLEGQCHQSTPAHVSPRRSHS